MCPVISNVNAITNLHLNYMYTDYSIFSHSLIGTKDFTWKKNDYLFKVNKKVPDTKFLRNVRKYIYITNKYTQLTIFYCGKKCRQDKKFNIENNIKIEIKYDWWFTS